MDVVGTVPVSLRIPGPLLEHIKVAANEHFMPYQRLMKEWLEERLAHIEPHHVPKPVRLRLTAEQIILLR